MKLSKKEISQRMEADALHLKLICEAPNPEGDKIISELREAAKRMPKDMSKEEETSYIIRGIDNETLAYLDNLFPKGGTE